MVAEQKRFKKRARQSFAFVLSVVCVIVLTIGELKPGLNIPSWSDMFGQLSSEPQSEPVQYAEELGGDILMSVHAIDVGQGDCTLVRVSDVTILIDSGERGNGDDVLEYIDDLGISRLDYVIATHPHSDHIGGLTEVMKGIDVDCLIMPEVSEDMIPISSAYSDFMDIAIEKKSDGMKIERATAGNTYVLTDYAEMTVLSPLGDSYLDLNDYSVAILIACNDVTFFSAGDITHTAEKELMEKYPNLLADLMKISHHGGDESNLKAFIRQLSPTYAYICCGEDNSYGHPTETVLDILDGYSVKYRRTDLEGSFVYYTDGKIFIED